MTIGVGDLYLERKLQSDLREIYLLDPGEKSIEQARVTLGRTQDRAKVGYSQAIPYADGEFDYVVMSEVLEHLDNDVLAATISEVFRVLSPSGKFVGTVPYNEDIQAAQVMCPHSSEVFHRVGHVQSFTVERLTGLLTRGFNEASVSVKVKFLPAVGILNWKGKLVAFLIKLLEKLGVYSSRSNLEFQAVK